MKHRRTLKTKIGIPDSILMMHCPHQRPKLRKGSEKKCRTSREQPKLVRVCYPAERTRLVLRKGLPYLIVLTTPNTPRPAPSLPDSRDCYCLSTPTPAPLCHPNRPSVTVTTFIYETIVIGNLT